MDFGTKLRAFRETKNLTQEVLAKQAGLSVDTIQNWEQGRTRPRLPALIRLAKTLGASLDELVADEKPAARRRRKPK